MALVTLSLVLLVEAAVCLEKNHEPKSLGVSPALPLASCVILGGLLHFSEPQFLQQKNRACGRDFTES